MAASPSLKHLAVPIGIEPMEAKLVAELPHGDGWQFEPKWDGFRCLAYRAGEEVDLRAKSGKPLTRYFPEIAAMLHGLPQKEFVLDGELAIPLGDTLSFDALQMRIHPAESRIKKLSVETPAILILFDMLLDAKGRSLIETALVRRRAALETFYDKARERAALKLSPYTRDRDEAERWLKAARGALDGVVAKRIDGAYIPGERAMLKVKQIRTADCVVGGFRYATGSRLVGSLLLGLYDKEGKLDHVGFTSTITNAERPALTRTLEALIAPPGFTGKAPGGPSRWSTERSGEWEPVKPKMVVEVRYDQVTGDRFRHGTKLVRFRPDKAPRQCTFEQIEPAVLPENFRSLLAF
ncbi:ATP-dependent DNA ligase [Methyloceanibacter sp.]|uniref:ATP-dependent DNA ligase n=1 Tax=Methyloceanibacter sp. TaxID=1965321 RepID=UPI002D68B736|nr:ATP-dependent DNA ligase [Methyloceanibacter sp.]HZP09041.1 ATP-dependent DNA ligase [Methyloceanibacter sp.]